jgi:hypothetical protein
MRADESLHQLLVGAPPQESADALNGDLTHPRTRASGEDAVDQLLEEAGIIAGPPDCRKIGQPLPDLPPFQTVTGL